MKLVLVLVWFKGFMKCHEGLAEKAKAMFHHAYDGYMRNAFPLDEIDPISCIGIGPDHRTRMRSKLHKALQPVQEPHDIRGGFSLTLIDALDTLAIMDDAQGFHEAVDQVAEAVISFDIDRDVSVFEVNIRVLGGLLSAHQFCTGDFGERFRKPGYKGELLELASDLGKRLLPAFDTATGIPVSRVNLKTGRKTSSTWNCPAAGGTFLLEFGVLSCLTGDRRFYEVAERAMMELWISRSELNLIGLEIDVESGEWKEPAAMIGAGIDSFYEYLLKGYILFGDETLLRMYKASRKAIKKHLLDSWAQNKIVHFQSGALYSYRFDALGAFYPGLLALGGEVKAAREAFDLYYLTALRYGEGLLPEATELELRRPLNREFNLRPELIESAYYLYHATRDPFYIRVGKQVLKHIEERCKTQCGYADLGDARKSDSKLHRTESFLMSETLKYLYLLFKEDHWVNRLEAPAVFSTEAHLLKMPTSGLSSRKVSKNFRCPAGSPTADEGLRMLQFWKVGMSSRDIDSYYADVWHEKKGMRVHDRSPLIELKPVELAPMAPNSILFIPSQQHFSKNATAALSIWPSIMRPSYFASRIGSANLRTNERAIIIMRRTKLKSEMRRKFFQDLLGNWVDSDLKSNARHTLASDFSKNSLFMPAYFRRETSRPTTLDMLKSFEFEGYAKAMNTSEIVKHLYENPREAIWSGLPIRNLVVVSLVDYAFDFIDNIIV